MGFDTSNIDPVALLDRICSVYGFHQKIQLATHFGIAASSLSNRYTRGNISYDFAALCALETGASLLWILTGDGEQFTGQPTSNNAKNGLISLDKFTLSEGEFSKSGTVQFDREFFSKPLVNPFCVISDSKTYLVESNSKLSDGEWLVDIEGMTSIRELTLLPAKRLHVAGGNVPFECSFDDIKTLGRVVGIYTEVN